MTVFKLDFPKMKTASGGSLVAFCRGLKIPREAIYHLDGKRYFKEGTKNQRYAELLVDKGYAEWKNELNSENK